LALPPLDQVRFAFTFPWISSWPALGCANPQHTENLLSAAGFEPSSLTLRSGNNISRRSRQRKWRWYNGMEETTTSMRIRLTTKSASLSVLGGEDPWFERSEAQQRQRSSAA